MDIILYHSNAEKNKVDKLNNLTGAVFISGNFKESQSIMQPIIDLVYNSLPTFNYLYIPALSRFYFINNITTLNNGMYRLECNEDVLMTYRTEIKQQTAYISRIEYNNDNHRNGYESPYLVDKELLSRNFETYQYYEITGGENIIDSTSVHNNCFLLNYVKSTPYGIEPLA